MRLYHVLLFLLLALTPAWGQAPPDSTNGAPRALPVSPDELKNAETLPSTVAGGVSVRWFGHGFIYLTSSVGIRAAIDPFGPATVHYTFPVHLAADFVLVSHETEDHCGADLIFGNPLIFRSVMAVGLQRANGIPFHGIGLQKDPANDTGANTAFTLTFDGVTFGYLGQVSQPLTVQEKAQLGHIDVLFLPVGLTSLTVAQLNQIVKDVGARIIVPINYKTDKSGDLNLRDLEEYLSETKLPRRKLSSSDFVITRATLPEEPTLYILKSP